jgi:RNA polymerase sigma-70 factor (ECF subfamily)
MEPRGTTNRIVETAYAVHSSTLRRRLTTITRDPAAAEDLVHDAFLRLHLEVEAGRAPDEIGAWLYRVSVNLAHSRGRRLSVADRSRAALVTRGEAPSPEALTIEAERSGLVRGALAQMNDTDREVLILSATGFRGPEIARQIGRTDLATRTMLHRARARLRARIMEASMG